MAFHKRLPWLFTFVSQLWPVVPELLRLWFRSNIIFIKRGLDFAPEGRLGSFGNRFGIHVAFHGQVLVFFALFRVCGLSFPSCCDFGLEMT